MLPLAGVRIIAVEQYGAGPLGTQILADLGAEVIKVENPGDGGDVSRAVGPYFTEGAEPSRSSVFFQGLNRGKRSLTLNLAKPAGQEVLRRLVVSADAITSNLRGDVPGKLGLTYDALRDVKPSIVCAHLTAYGRSGPRATWPGYDYLIQAETGYFSLNGEPGTPPARFGLSIVDFTAAYLLATAIVSGVLSARLHGVGRDVDVSLFDAGLSNLNYVGNWRLNAGHVQGQEFRSAHPSLTPCQLYTTADGWIFVMANKEKFWPVLCRHLGHAEWIDDARFRDFRARFAHREMLTDLIDSAFRTRTTADWLDQLRGSVPVAPVYDMAQAMETEFVQGSIQDVALHEGPTLRLIAAPIRCAGEVRRSDPPPSLGADTADILTEIGYRPDEIEGLKQTGIL